MLATLPEDSFNKSSSELYQNYCENESLKEVCIGWYFCEFKQKSLPLGKTMKLLDLNKPQNLARPC